MPQRRRPRRRRSGVKPPAFASGRSSHPSPSLLKWCERGSGTPPESRGPSRRASTWGSHRHRSWRGMRKAEEHPCERCGSTTRIIRTETEPETGRIKRRRQCGQCRFRCTTISDAPSTDKTAERPPLSAWAAGKIIRRAARATAAAAKANFGSTVALRDYSQRVEPTESQRGKNDVDFLE
jgi:hypothetical protein